MSTPLPVDDPRFAQFMAGCPSSWQGDHGFQQWMQGLYDLGAAGGFPALPTPVLSAIAPDTGPANTDIALTLSGTDFDPLATVNIGIAFGLVPSSVTPTEISVLVQAGNIAEPGTLGVSVTNPDGQVSAVVDFTVSNPARLSESGKTSQKNGQPKDGDRYTENPDWVWHENLGQWVYSPQKERLEGTRRPAF
jgi:hypothetical protein